MDNWAIGEDRLRDFIRRYGDTPSGLTARIELANMLGGATVGEESWRLLEEVQRTPGAGWRKPLAQWKWVTNIAGITLGTPSELAPVADRMVALLPELAPLDEVDDEEMWQAVTGSTPLWYKEGHRPMKHRFLAVAMNQIAGWHWEADRMEERQDRLRQVRPPSDFHEVSVHYWKQVVRDYPLTPEAAEAASSLRDQANAVLCWKDWHAWAAARTIDLGEQTEKELLDLRHEWAADAKKRGLPGFH